MPKNVSSSKDPRPQYEKDLEAWGTEKPPLLVGLAKNAVESADDLFFFLELFRNRDGTKNFPPPPKLRIWLPLFRTHRRMQDVLAEKVIGPEFGLTNGADEWRAFLDEIKRFDRLSTQEKISEIGDYLKRVSTDERRTLVDQFRAGLPEPEAATTEEMALPEFQYFLRVYWPCWLLYYESPSKLMRRARYSTEEGLEAFENLVRVDKSIIFEPRIAEMLHQLSAGPNQRRFQLYAKAIGKPFPKISRKRIKISLAGFVSKLFYVVHSEATAPDIRKLFEIVAKRKHGPQVATDHDLPAGDWAFAKALERERKFWTCLP